MTTQRWFLTTPEQYAAAPVGTQVWPYRGCRYSVVLEDDGVWRTSDLGGFRPYAGSFCRREVKRWGTDADHQRACEALR